MTSKTKVKAGVAAASKAILALLLIGAALLSLSMWPVAARSRVAAASTTEFTCSFNFPTSMNANPNALIQHLPVTANNWLCFWTAKSNSNWISITNSPNHLGNGTVDFIVQDNPGPQRSGSLTVAGKTVTVIQASGCYIAAPASQDVSAAGGDFVLNFDTGLTCPWQLSVSNSLWWIKFTSATSGIGPSPIHYTVLPNYGAARGAGFALNNFNFVVHQAAGTMAARAAGDDVAQRFKPDGDKEEDVDLSALHYATRHRPATLPETGEEGEETTGKIKSNDTSTEWQNELLSRPAVPHWNSPAGRAAAAEWLTIGEEIGATAQAALHKEAPVNIPSYCTTPVLTAPGSQCCSYLIKEQKDFMGQVSDKDVWYSQPYHIFTGTDSEREQAAQTFSATVRASLPMFLPFKDSHVYPSGGWFYDNGGFHGAIDYGRDNAQVGVDPTFGVYAVADGRVISVLWDDWMGNTVIVEHRAANGDRYRSTYMHMRNGFTHDLAKARAIDRPLTDWYDSNGKPTNWLKYHNFAWQANPNPLYWGTDLQTIPVKAGDLVTAGQFIGWSGNTGAGGAGNGLYNDGTPTNLATANNHLHLMTTVPDPRPDQPNDWVQVDPYGVYAQANTGCYDLLDETKFVRLFAPFYPSFHNVPLAVVSKYFGYYPGMGMGLQTLSLYRQGSAVLASGSFQGGLSKQWYAGLYLTAAQYQTAFNQYSTLGYRPREISVTPDSNGDPRYNVIWKKTAGEGYIAYTALTDAEWQQKWNQHVNNSGLVVDEHTAYDTNSGPRHAVIFVDKPKTGFVEYHYQSLPSFYSFNNTFKAQGLQQTNLDVEEVNGGTYFGGIWRPAAGTWVTFCDLTPQDYQLILAGYTAQGYRLWRVRGYANSTRFAATWVK